MSSVVVRRIASTPARTASQAWEKIVELLAPNPKSPARAELLAAAGVACSAISSESTQDDAIVVWGSGPRVRVYCAFGEGSLTGDDVNEDALAKSPTDGDWSMSIPCPSEDVTWSQTKLATFSKRVTARAVGEDVTDETTEASSRRSLAINAEEFLKP
jgi:hypothetical protein